MSVSKPKRPRILLIHRCFVINKKGQLLAIKRSLGKSPLSGYWEVPGGKVEKKQHLGQSLERELLEECNLKIQTTSPLAYYESEFSTHPKYLGLAYVLIINICTTQNDKITLSHEHDDFCWLAPAKFTKLKLSPEVKKAYLTLNKEIRLQIKRFAK